jgi:hypothetical protein
MGRDCASELGPIALAEGRPEGPRNRGGWLGRAGDVARTEPPKSARSADFQGGTRGEAARTRRGAQKGGQRPRERAGALTAEVRLQGRAGAEGRDRRERKKGSVSV